MFPVTHCISDLHLCQTRPELTRLFEYYMQNIAPKSNQLFVLGDLFEAWIGDDCLQEKQTSTQLYLNVITLFKDYANNHGKLFFIHGNRDFLLGEVFEKETHGEILSEPYLTTMTQKKIGFLHGDSLCTDDIAYQEFRRTVRNPQWQKEFLSLPMAKRIEIASGLRQQSKDAQAEKTAEIMDVNKESVEKFFIEYNVDWLIHGHTHRPAIHQLTINNKNVQRIVLSDWGARGHYLSINSNRVDEHYFTL